MLRHIVLFKFASQNTEAEVQEIIDRFSALESLIDGVAEFEWGVNVSPENLDQGFTHCFQLTFATAKERDAYLPHPHHLAFVEFLGAKIEKGLVVDYETSQ